MKHGQKSTRSSTVQGQAGPGSPEEPKLRGCVSAHLRPVPFSTPQPRVVLPELPYRRLMLWSAPRGRNMGLPAK